jgi:predicted Na+-dependent transporter
MGSLNRWRGPVVNWSFFFIVYTIVGLNRHVFLQEPSTLLLVSAIAFVSTFIIAEVINQASRLLGVPREDRISLMLLGTRKTCGLAGAIALLFVSARAAMPSAVATVIAILHYTWLFWRVRRMQ